jgi:hypothetical protein
MRLKTQLITSTLLLGICVSSASAQQPVKAQTPPKQSAGGQAESVPDTVTISPLQPAQTSQPVNGPGYMEPAQVKALAHKIWIAEYRINDLLAQVHPEKWKISNVTRNSFNQTLENLRRAMQGLEEWRAQFEKRPDGMYFGFQTYTAINAALPRLDGVGRAASQFENPSLGAQYSQAGNQLFDLQQALQPYIAYLLRNPDQALYVAQTNLAGCQSQLGSALNGQSGPAKPLKNTFVEFHGRRQSKGQPEAPDNRKSLQGGETKAASKTEKKSEPQPRKTPSPP